MLLNFGLTSLQKKLKSRWHNVMAQTTSIDIIYVYIQMRYEREKRKNKKIKTVSLIVAQEITHRLSAPNKPINERTNQPTSQQTNEQTNERQNKKWKANAQCERLKYANIMTKLQGT